VKSEVVCAGLSTYRPGQTHVEVLVTVPEAEALAEKIGRLASAAMVGEAAQADGWDAKLWRLAAEMAASHGHHSFSLRCLAIAEAIGGKA